MIRTTYLASLALGLAVLVAAPAAADTLLVYSQAGLANQSSYFQWCLEGEAFCSASEFINCANPEGGTVQ